ncbi:hypothetical protein [Rhodanobacter ginsengiterrae]|uniref:hypothetical protein n=1 Tax=Rhodanobacter ginsengiterrae TaxID=2008451 RepID=UPI003CEA9006
MRLFHACCLLTLLAASVTPGSRSGSGEGSSGGMVAVAGNFIRASCATVLASRNDKFNDMGATP